ncbi:GNAT family N-acetyltransferase [Sphingomonas sp. RB1R13]|uniref:GNAT family N-acetyltransferase n=1 Tax=Sphingomonas sp. RB1R13 TaxID=3096159 RepID=UPI002FCA9FBC
MTIMLRDVTVDDARLVCAVFTTGFKATFAHLYAPEDLALFMSQVTPDAFMREIADPEFRFQLAEVDGVAAGFAKVAPPGLPGFTPAATRELRQLYVLDQFMGAGVGPALMDWVIADAKAWGARHLQLSVYVDNARARRFYEKRGFRVIGPYKFMVGNHADEDVIMRVKL